MCVYIYIYIYIYINCHLPDLHFDRTIAGINVDPPLRTVSVDEFDNNGASGAIRFFLAIANGYNPALTVK